MPIISTKKINGGSQYIIVLEEFTTTDATPAVSYSYPIIQSQCVKVQIEYTAYSSDFTLAASGELFSTFVRASGNVSRSSGTGTGGLDGTVQGNFPNAEPKPDLIANTSTNAIDITLTGKASTTIKWHIILNISPYI